MAKFKPYKILSSQLNSLPIVDGQLIVTTDTLDIYIDDGSKRTKLPSGSIGGGTSISISKEQPDLPTGGIWFVEED